MENILQRVRQLNEVFQQSVTTVIPLRDLCTQLGNIIDCNIYLFYSTGEIFAYSIAEMFHCAYNDEALRASELPPYYLDIFTNSSQSQFNVYQEKPLCTCEGVDACIYKNRYYSMIPVYSGLVKKAGMLLIRYEAPFEQDEEILCEYTAAIISIDLIRQEQERLQRESIEIARAKLAVNALTFSELKSGAAVLQQIEGDMGTVFLNTIAEQTYATQSLVSAALKKLEIAGMIETKSRGVRGKEIIIRNAYLRQEIASAEQIAGEQV